jgi:hypothetical protein
MKNIKHILITFFVIAFLLLPMGFDYAKKSKPPTSDFTQLKTAGGTIAGNGLQLTHSHKLTLSKSDSIGYDQEADRPDTLNQFKDNGVDLILKSKDTTSPVGLTNVVNCNSQRLTNITQNEIWAFCPNFILENLESKFQKNQFLQKIYFSQMSKMILSNQVEISEFSVTHVEDIIKLENIPNTNSQRYKAVTFNNKCWIYKLPSWKFIYANNSQIDSENEKAWVLKHSNKEYVIGCF